MERQHDRNPLDADCVCLQGSRSGTVFHQQLFQSGPEILGPSEERKESTNGRLTAIGVVVGSRRRVALVSLLARLGPRVGVDLHQRRFRGQRRRQPQTFAPSCATPKLGPGGSRPTRQQQPEQQKRKERESSSLL